MIYRILKNYSVNDNFGIQDLSSDSGQEEEEDSVNEYLTDDKN